LQAFDCGRTDEPHEEPLLAAVFGESIANVTSRRCSHVFRSVEATAGLEIRRGEHAAQDVVAGALSAAALSSENGFRFASGAAEGCQTTRRLEVPDKAFGEEETMAEETAGATRARRATPSGGEQETGATSPLKSDRGGTTIDNLVVTKVAAIAARETRGVYDLGGGAARAFGAVTERVGVAMSDERSRGVSVEVGEREAAVDLTLVIEYGESIPQVSDAVRENVIKRIEGITGLSVAEVNIAVNDLHFPGDDTPEESRVS
jgi:uncharacterized alkaline shock family protein YloU